MNDAEIYIKTIELKYDPESFHLVIISGYQSFDYALSPKHAKRFLLLLQKQVAGYEKIFGELITSLPLVKEGKDQSKKIGYQT